MQIGARVLKISIAAVELLRPVNFLQVGEKLLALARIQFDAFPIDRNRQLIIHGM